MPFQENSAGDVSQNPSSARWRLASAAAIPPLAETIASLNASLVSSALPYGFNPAARCPPHMLPARYTVCSHRTGAGGIRMRPGRPVGSSQFLTPTQVQPHLVPDHHRRHCQRQSHFLLQRNCLWGTRRNGCQRCPPAPHTSFSRCRRRSVFPVQVRRCLRPRVRRPAHHLHVWGLQDLGRRPQDPLR